MQESKESFEMLMGNEELNGVPLLLIANKQDIDKSIPLSQVKEVFGYPDSDLIASRESHAIATSALKGEGIKESISWMETAMKNNGKNRPPKTTDD